MALNPSNSSNLEQLALKGLTTMNTFCVASQAISRCTDFDLPTREFSLQRLNPMNNDETTSHPTAVDADSATWLRRISGRRMTVDVDVLLAGRGGGNTTLSEPSNGL